MRFILRLRNIVVIFFEKNAYTSSRDGGGDETRFSLLIFKEISVVIKRQSNCKSFCSQYDRLGLIISKLVDNNL